MQSILGHHHPKAALASALRAGRFHHAWIFSGPKGVGKFTTAIELAKLLLDPAPLTDLHGNLAADPASKTSALISSRSHPDLHLIYKELALFSDDPQVRSRKLLNIPVAVLRERMIGGLVADRYHDAPVFRTPVLAPAKVFILDEAELIDRDEGQNALLKTLEEPPVKTYIFLITSRPALLLPTIRSRCQHLRFGPLAPADFSAWFAGAKLDLSADQRLWVTQFAEGSPGLALLAAQYNFHDWHTRLAPHLAQLAHGSFPVPLGELLHSFTDSFALAWVKTHKNASKDSANKDGARHVLSLLAFWLRARLADPAPALPLNILARAVPLLRDAESQLESNVHSRFVFENLVTQLALRFAPQPA